MFLALKEINHYKLRYTLVISTIFLITFMIFFITSLAIGLAQVNRNAIDNFDASSAVLSKYANDNLISSVLAEDDVKDYYELDTVAPLGQLSVVVNQKDSENKVDSNIFAIDFKSFITPNIVEGSLPSSEYEIVVDESIESDDITIGSKIQINGSENLYDVVGVTKNSNFLTTPLIYMNIDEFQYLKFGSSDINNINSLIVKDNQELKISDTDQISIQTLIKNIPGYQAQVLTFSFMIGAMVLITFLIIAIFMYIITIQKINTYAIMRAQGISNKTLTSSLFIQILILVLSAIILAFILITLTSLILPPGLPFNVNYLVYILIAFLILIMSLLGGLLSLRSILKIDPETALGEN